MFDPVEGSVSFPEVEARIGKFWTERRIYEKSLEARAGSEKFVFFEGPPTANGLPHPGHCLTRAIKDVFPRYRTMRGYLCERKGGWDTHGLPVEVEVCKELGIHSKEEIEQYGVEPFIHKCQASVWRYMKEWERLTERMGFWIHLDEAYVTYHQSYVESVWWALKRFFDQGLLYQGHKIVWWWAQGGTALSSGEVGQGYREVADPSVYVRCPLVDRPDTTLLVWTTTPWTLPSNQFIAVHPELEYSIVTDGETDGELIIASDLVKTVADKVKRELNVVSTCKGSELIGQRYVPPFDYYYKTTGTQMGTLANGEAEAVAWRVIAADFVTTESGTGVVHQAPAFGEVDYEVLQNEQQRYAEDDGPELICAVAPDGKFTNVAGEYEGRWVKDADKDLSRELRTRGLLYHQDQYIHDYPFCWRAEEDPLIQYPRKSWFIRTTSFKEQLLANNQSIGWHPEHIRDGRFGNFLESNVDWALSRERYWGTPLPIWVCDKTGNKEAVVSYDELLKKPGSSGTEAWERARQANPELPEDLKVHKPYIDEVTYDSPFAAGGRMQRVTEVIDCWFDSGAMPFAQWGYPHQGGDAFAEQFPADFISEAIDQTRGWFYSLLAISTLLFREEDQASSGKAHQDSTELAEVPSLKTHRYPHPFRNCIVLGLMLAEWWESRDGKQQFLTEDDARETCGSKYTHRVGKMSKQLRNYRPPQEIFDTYGADALRWYFFANQPPWNSIIYSEKAIKESIPEFLLRLWNVYSFFVIYANIDKFDPAAHINGDVGQLGSESLTHASTYRAPQQRGELDRWILSELNRTASSVTTLMDDYDNYVACIQLKDFAEALSNWYVRRSRDRFWNSEDNDPNWSDEKAQDKLDAHWTLYECLITTSKLIAPFVPFLADAMWQTLAGVFGERVTESVHLCDYPVGNSEYVDENLSAQMQLAREISSLGRSVRANEKLKVRQPLAKVEVILASQQHRRWLESHAGLVCDELNVKQVNFTSDAEKYIDYEVQPNFKRLGPRVGRLIPAVKKALQEIDGGPLLSELTESGKFVLNLPGGENVELSDEDIQVRLVAKEGWAAAQGKLCVVVLATELTPELVREGFARDLSRLINDRRKELGCQFTDRIVVGIVTDSDELRAAVAENLDFVQRETLAIKIIFESLDAVDPIEVEVAGHGLKLYVQIESV